MSEEENGCSTVSSQSQDVGPCTWVDQPVVAESSTTANGSSATGSSTTSNTGTAKSSSGSTANSGSTTHNSGKTANANSSIVSRGKMATGSLVTDSSDTATNGGSLTDNSDMTADRGSVTDNSGTTANSGSVTDNSDMTVNGDATTTNVGPETGGPVVFSSKTDIGCRMRYEKRDLEILEQEFLSDPRPNLTKRLEIAGFIQKKEDQVRSWFQRRRRKQRKEDGVPLRFRRKPKAEGSPPRFADLSIRNEQSDNLSYYPTPKHEEVKVRDQTFVPKFYSEVNEGGDGILWQHQLPSGTQVGGDHDHSPINRVPDTNKLDRIPGQDVGVTVRDRMFVPNFYREVNRDLDGIPLQQQPHNSQRVVRDHFCPPVNTSPITDELDQSERNCASSPINSGLSNMYYTVLGEDGKILFRHRKFVSKFYNEVNGDIDGIPLQQQPHSGQRVEKDSSSSPFNTGPIANEHDRAQGQKIVRKDHPLALNHHTELISSGHEVQKQQQLNDDRQTERDRYSTPINSGLSTTNSTIVREDGDIIFRHRKFVPNFYRDVNLCE